MNAVDINNLVKIYDNNFKALNKISSKLGLAMNFSLLISYFIYTAMLICFGEAFLNISNTEYQKHNVF